MASTLPFVGRELELASLRETCAEAGAAVVVGEAGLGKSRLIAELCNDDGLTCIVGTGASELQSSPYAVFRTLALQWGHLLDPHSLGWSEHQLTNLGPLFPELQPAATPNEFTAEEQRHALWLSLLRYLDAVVASRPKPLVIVIEDLHAADPSSLALFAWLASQSVGFAIIATSQPPAPDAVAKLPTIGLRPLGLGSVQEIQRVSSLVSPSLGATGSVAIAAVSASFGATSGETLLELTGGVPQRLHEWMLGKSLGGAVQARGALLDRMLDGCSESTVDALRFMAVFPGRVDAYVLCHVLDITEGEVTAALGDAESRRVTLRHVDGSWDFQHDTYRSSLLAGLDRDQLHFYKRRVVQGLSGHLAARPELLGQLAAVSTELGDDRIEAARLHLAAGHYAAGQLAPVEARSHYEAAVELSEKTGQHQLALESTLSLGLVLAALSDSGASEVLAKVYPLADALDDGDSFARAALAEPVGLGHVGTAIMTNHLVVARLRRAVASATDPMLRARVLASLAVQQHSTLPHGEYFSLVDQAEAAAAPIGDPALDSHLLAARFGMQRPPDMPVDLRRDVAARLDALEPFDPQSLPLVDLGVMLACRAGDLNGAERLIRRYQDEFSPLPVVAQWSVLRARTAIAFARGTVELARSLSLEALHITTGTRLDQTALDHFGFQVAALLRERRKMAEARPTLETWVVENPSYAAFRASRAWLCADMGDLAAARSDLEVFFSQDLVELRGRIEGPLAIAMAVCAAFGVGSDDGHEWSRRGHELLEPLAHEWLLAGQGSLIDGPVVRVMALASSAQGNVDRALAENAEAHRLAQEAGALLFVWHALRDRGIILRNAGRIPQAIEALQDAADRYRSAGLTQQGEWLMGEISGLRESDMDSPDSLPSSPSARGEFRRGHKVWHVGLGDEQAICRHLKGMSMIAALLAKPGRDIAAPALAAVGDGTAMTPVHAALAAESGQLLIDDAAVEAYRTRLDQIVKELDRADRAGDPASSARLTAEFDAITAELGSAYGLGRRRRSMTTEEERSRIRVTKAIRSAIRRVGEQAPDLALHLERSIDTGLFCSYRPDPLRPVEWSITSPDTSHQG